MISCSKKTEVPNVETRLDQITGLWKWQSTCGGIINSCAYSSDTNYAEIKFTKDNQLIETFRDSIYLTANYTVITSNGLTATLNLVNIDSKSLNSHSIQYPISIKNDELFIMRGELLDTYKKIK